VFCNEVLLLFLHVISGFKLLSLQKESQESVDPEVSSIRMTEYLELAVGVMKLTHLIYIIIMITHLVEILDSD